MTALELGSIGRTAGTAILSVALLASCGPTYVGTLVVTSDTTLASSVLGQIEIAADNLTLDCQNFPVIDVGTAANCRSGTRSCGIKIQNRADVTVYNCEVFGFDDGFWVSASTNVHIEASLAEINEVGFYIEDSERIDVVRNAAVANLGEGFAVRRTNDAFFWNNSAVQNERDGFDENDGSSAYYLRNDSYNNGFNGFELDFGPDPIYWENWVFANGQHGISLDAVAGALVHANETVVSGEDGLRLDDEGGSGSINGVVEDNYSSGNGRWAAHQCGSICTGNVYTNNWFIGPLNNIP